jgi:hypothetical protein
MVRNPFDKGDRKVVTAAKPTIPSGCGRQSKAYALWRVGLGQMLQQQSSRRFTNNTQALKLEA